MRKVLAVLLIIALALPAIPSIAGTDSAWVDFSNNKAMQNFSYVTFASQTTAVSSVNSVQIDGTECWQMEDGENKEYIRFNIDNSFISAVKDGTGYIISVEYYDGDEENTEQGFFSLEYDAIDRKCKFGGMVVLTNTGTWKTAEFKLDDAYFGTRLMNRAADFRLTVVPQKSATYDASPVPVAIKKVRVEPSGVKRDIRIVASTTENGNAFGWDSDAKVITTTLENTTSTDIVANVTFRALLDGDKTLFETTKNMTFAAGDIHTENLEIPLTRCGVYTWIVDVVQSNGNQYDKRCMNFAIIKTDKDGIKNDKAFVAHHLNRYFVKGGENREILEGMDLIAKSNAGGIRAESGWSEMKPQATSELTFTDTSAELINRLAGQHNLDVTWLLSGGNYAVTGAWNAYPDTTEEMNAYKEYVAFVARNVKENAASFEVAHEIDNLNFNPVINSETGEVDATPQEYATLIKETASALADENIEKPLIAYGLVSLADDVFSTWVGTGMENDVFDTLNTFSYHPYTRTYCPESAWNLWYFAPRIKQKIQNANPKATMAITELGTSLSTDTYIHGKRSRGANLCRGGIAYTVRGLADFVTHYVFEDKGQLSEIAYEDGFGMVDFCTESLRDDSDAIFVPNDTYVSFTAMNYVLGKSEPWQVFELDEYISASGFTSEKFNSKVVVLNTKGNTNSEEINGAYDITKNVTLQLGTNQITCFDDFGNETKLISDNGCYNFSLNERPLYLVGDIREVSLKSDSTFGINTGNIKFNQLSSDLVLYADDSKTYTYELLLPDCISVERENNIVSGTATVPLVLNEELPEKSVAEAVIRDADGNHVFFGQITLEQVTELDFPDNSVFEVKNVRTDIKRENEKTVLTGNHSDDFSTYTGFADPGLNKENTKDYAAVDGSLWSRSGHTQTRSWWGQGTYVNKGMLCIDAYSNVNPITIGAIRAINEDGSSVKDNLFNVSFDMAYYVHESHDGSSFTLYADETPIFNISRAEVNLYKNQQTSEKMFLGLRSFAKETYGEDLIKVTLSFDFPNEKIIMQYGNIIRETTMCDTLLENGVTSLKFAVSLLNGIDGGNGEYRGNAFVIDNYSDELLVVSTPATYVTELYNTENLPPTSAKLKIMFSHTIDAKAIQGITVVDHMKNGIDTPIFISEDQKALTLEIPLQKKMGYTLTVPQTIAAVDGQVLEGDYQYNFATGEILRLLDENSRVIGEEDLKKATFAHAEILTNAPEQAGTYTFVIAVFNRKNDVLKHIVTEEISYKNGDIVSHSDIVQLAEDEYAKVFVWNTLQSLNPVIDSHIIGMER